MLTIYKYENNLTDFDFSLPKTNHFYNTRRRNNANWGKQKLLYTMLVKSATPWIATSMQFPQLAIAFKMDLSIHNIAKLYRLLLSVATFTLIFRNVYIIDFCTYSLNVSTL